MKVARRADAERRPLENWVRRHPQRRYKRGDFMHYPWMIIVGSSIAGWLLVEVFAVFGKARVPATMNVLGAIAGAMIAGGFVL